MDDFEELERLSLVSKVSSELQNYLGVADSTIAEFVIAEHEKHRDAPEAFKRSLEEYDFPESLTTSIDRLVRTLHPKYKSDANAASNDTNGHGKEDKSKKFKGLSMPDKVPTFDDEEPETGGADLDDTFAMLESMAGDKKPTASRKRSVSPVAQSDPHDRKRSRRSRSRSRTSSDARGLTGQRRRSIVENDRATEIGTIGPTSTKGTKGGAEETGHQSKCWMMSQYSIRFTMAELPV
jgi:ATP-dependent RNA helicase DHX8/PRP22